QERGETRRQAECAWIDAAVARGREEGRREVVVGGVRDPIGAVAVRIDRGGGVAAGARAHPGAFGPARREVSRVRPGERRAVDLAQAVPADQIAQEVDLARLTRRRAVAPDAEAAAGGAGRAAVTRPGRMY